MLKTSFLELHTLLTNPHKENVTIKLAYFVINMKIQTQSLIS